MSSLTNQTTSQASTISNTDCRTRRDGWLGNKRIELPNTPGVDIVGKIYRIDHESSKQLGLSKGDRIVSLVSQGGNSRFLPVNPTSLVKISEKVDPAEAVCLVETYLTAFQTLHHNQSFLTRYRKNSLLGKTILVIGGMSAIMARSMSQLAQYAGCKATFATSQKRDFKNLSENGILPLPLDPVEWWEQLAGAVDILISLDEEVIPLHHKLLKLDGTVVVSSTHFHEDLLNEGIQTSQRKLICSTAKSRALSQTTRYDLYEEWEANPGRVKKDLAYLIDLLEKRKVIPKVIDRVPLEKVAEIQELLEKRRAKGHYVCEPWLVSKSRAVSL
jgi:NADPH:quinone reductase-like Zn-dependent oxidoreductase